MTAIGSTTITISPVYGGTGTGVATSAVLLGASVVSWTDQGPNKYIFNSGLGLPSYSATAGPNGLPTVIFDSAQGLTSASINPIKNDSVTMFTIQQCYFISTSAGLFSTQFGSGRSYAQAFITNRVLAVAGGADNFADGTATTNWEAWTTANSVGNILFRYNGGNQVSQNDGQFINVAPFNVPPTGGTYLGTANSNGHPTNGALYEVIVYNRMLNPEEILLVEQI